VEEFKCEESARNARGYCPFHDVIYPIMTEEEGMRGMIIDKINRWFSEEEYKRKPLKFIGYNIPGMDLSEYVFTEDIYFCKSIFRGPVSFNNVTFQRVDFSDVVFQSAYFDNVTFSKMATFECITSGKLEFIVCRFKTGARFREANIEEIEVIGGQFGMEDNADKRRIECDFQFARLKRTTFRNVKFCTVTTFGDTEFGEATFSNRTEFFNQADFSNSRFLGIGNFLDVKFNGTTNFHHVIFQDQECVLFDVNSLSEVSFIGSDIMRVRFGERVVWREDESNKFIIRDEIDLIECINPIFTWEKVPSDPKHEKNLRCFLKKRLRLNWVTQDSRIEKSNHVAITITSSKTNDDSKIAIVLREKTALISLDNNNNKFAVKRKNNEINIYSYVGFRLNAVLAIYRNLRENYEYRLRYEEAAEFFVREMELKRKYKEKYTGDIYEVQGKHPLSKAFSLLGIYQWLSNMVKVISAQHYLLPYWSLLLQ
jgi:uncharacterized protein YjbI with pentapeptide repeats